MNRRSQQLPGFALQILVFGLAVAFAPAALAQPGRCDPSKAAERFPHYVNKTVNIGANPTYPPFSFSDPADFSRMSGLDVDIIEHAMRCAGLNFQYEKGATAGLYPALFAGTLDAMIGNIFIRPDRLDRASFVLYMVNGQSLVINKGNPLNISSVSSMCGHTATGLFVGTSAMLLKDIGEKCVEHGKASVGYMAASDQEQAYRALENKRTDMVMDGAASAALRVKASSGTLEIAFTPPPRSSRASSCRRAMPRC